jgi:type IV secretory pathway VirB2 component (pilin)
MKKTLLLVLFSASSAAAEVLIPIGGDQVHIDTVTAIVGGISLGLAAVMFVLNGFKWITADDPQDRLEARKALTIILVAILMLMLAAAFVNMFYSIPTGY